MVSTILRGLQVVNGNGETALQLLKVQIRTKVRELYLLRNPMPIALHDIHYQQELHHKNEKAQKSMDFTLEAIQLVFDNFFLDLKRIESITGKKKYFSSQSSGSHSQPKTQKRDLRTTLVSKILLCK